MPRFIIEHDTGRLTPDQLRGAAEKSNAVLAEMPYVKWIKSYVSDAEGKIYCEYDAPEAEAVMAHAKRTGIPANRISEVAMEIGPSMFM